MNLERINEIEKQDEERKAANLLSSTLSTLKFQETSNAFDFLANEVKSLAESHSELFFLEEYKNEFIVSLGSKEGRDVFIYFKNNFDLLNPTFSIKVGKNEVGYKVIKRENKPGFEIHPLGNEKDVLGFSGIVVNDLLKINLINTFNNSLNKWIFETAEQKIESK